jgi:uncharacterized protein YjbI with pentapeptide repeats
MVVEHELTAAQLCDAYRRGQRLFTGVELVSTDEYPSLRDATLSGAEFSDCWFHSANFSSVDLSQTKFVHCNLKCSTFANCDLSGSTWSNCSVCSISIVGSATTDVVVDGLDAYGAAIENPVAFLAYASGRSPKRGSE